MPDEKRTLPISLQIQRPLTQAELEEFLGKYTMGIIATLNKDGTPHQTPVSCTYGKGWFIVPSQRDLQKVKNVRRDPRISILLRGQSGPDKLDTLVIASGPCELREDQASGMDAVYRATAAAPEDVKQRVRTKYNTEARVAIWLKPTKIISWQRGRD